MKLFVFLGLVFSALVAFAAFASNAENEKIAKGMCEDAVSYYKEVGETKAWAAFNNAPEGRFKKGEIYVYAVDKTGKMLAHGVTPGLVNQNLSTLPLIKDSMALIKDNQGEGGWVDYLWTNPTTKKLAKKRTYVKALGSDNKFVACGFYKE